MPSLEIWSFQIIGGNAGGRGSTYCEHNSSIVSPAKQKRDICIAFSASSLSSSSAAA